MKIEINNDSRGLYPVNSQIKFKITMLKSTLCDYSDVCILTKWNIKVNNAGTTATPTNRNEKWYLRIVLHLLTASAK